MTTTALEDWGKTQGQGGHGGAGQDTNLHIDESDIRANGTPDFDQTGEDAGAAADAVADAEEEQRALRKRKQVNQILVGGGVVALAMVATVVGSMLLKRDQPAQMAQTEAAAPVAQVQQVGIQPGAPLGPNGAIGDNAPVQQFGPVAAAPDFGLQAAPTAEARLPNNQAAVSAAPTSLHPASDGGGLSLQTMPHTRDVSVLGAPVGTQLVGPESALKASSPPVAAAPGQISSSDVVQMRADIAELRASIASKEEDVSKLRQEVANLKTQGAPKAVAARAAAPKRQPMKAKSDVESHAATDGSPAVVVVTERVVDRGSSAAPVPATPTVAIAASHKGKVRSDYRIYAAVDGRFWVVGPDSEPIQVGAASPLSDGTRVTSIDTEKNVIHTNAGEIR